MEPINHRFANMTLQAPAGQEDEVLPLPVWLAVLSGQTQPPVWLHAEREVLQEAPAEETDG